MQTSWNLVRSSFGSQPTGANWLAFSILMTDPGVVPGTHWTHHHVHVKPQTHSKNDSWIIAATWHSRSVFTLHLKICWQNDEGGVSWKLYKLYMQKVLNSKIDQEVVANTNKNKTNSLSFPCSEKFLSIPGFLGLWPPCKNLLTKWRGWSYMKSTNSTCRKCWIQEWTKKWYCGSQQQ